MLLPLTKSQNLSYDMADLLAELYDGVNLKRKQKNLLPLTAVTMLSQWSLEITDLRKLGKPIQSEAPAAL